MDTKLGSLNPSETMQKSQVSVNEKIAQFEKEYKNICTSTNTDKDGTSNCISKQQLLQLANDIVNDINTYQHSDTSFNMMETDKKKIYGMVHQIQNNKYNSQLDIRRDIQGSLEDTKSRYTSTYLHYLMNFLVVVTIIGIILYFYFNRDDSVFATAAVLITALVLVYLGAKYEFTAN